MFPFAWFGVSHLSVKLMVLLSRAIQVVQKYIVTWTWKKLSTCETLKNSNPAWQHKRSFSEKPPIGVLSTSVIQNWKKIKYVTCPCSILLSRSQLLLNVFEFKPRKSVGSCASLKCLAKSRMMEWLSSQVTLPGMNLLWSWWILTNGCIYWTESRSWMFPLHAPRSTFPYPQ